MLLVAVAHLLIIAVDLRRGVEMIDHEMHKIRVKAVSDRMSHRITYNDAGAPKKDSQDHVSMMRENKEDMREMRRDGRFRNMLTGGR